MQIDDGLLRDFLIDSGVLTRSQLSSLNFTQGKPLTEVLVETGMLSEDELRRAAAHALGIPFVMLGREHIALDALNLIPEPLARSHNIVGYGLGRDGELEVALLDMADLSAIEYLRPQLTLKPRLTNRESIKRALLIYQKHLKEKFAELAQNGLHAADALLRHAIHSGATHIHIEPALTGSLVRYRIGGLLREAMRLPEHAGGLITNRIKALGKLFPISTSPQEGRFAFEHGGQNYAVGVSTLPLQRGEKVSMRLAREHQGQQGFTLESLGLHGRALERVHEIVRRERGLTAVVGPHGAGKSTLMYVLLDLLNEPHLSLATVEEKIGFDLPHVAQTQVRADLGQSMAAASRAALRTDPDVLAIDACESHECAAIVESAAHRGTMVIALTENFDNFEKVDALIELRQARKLCEKCKVKHRPAREELDGFEGSANFAKVLSALREEGVVGKHLAWKDVVFYEAVGCDKCEDGYRGSIGLQGVSDPANETLNLIEDAVFKAAQGLTSLEEVKNALGVV